MLVVLDRGRWLLEGAATKRAECSVVVGAGGRDRDDAGVAALQHPGAKGRTELGVAVGMELVRLRASAEGR